MTHPRLHTRLTELTGVRHPIVQTGMGWVSGPELTAATAAAGGLGIIASATLSPEDMLAAIRAVKESTDAPFGVNVRGDAPDALDRARTLIREGVRVASFALAPRAEVIGVLKDAGVVVIPSVGARRHAEKVQAMGADAVLVQGGEGGGHTGQVATTLLLPQVVDAVDIPVIAAGGFFDGRGLVAALAYGAEGIAMGTRFLLTSDSTVPAQVKRAYLDSAVDGTVVTDAIDGVPQRVLRTPMVQQLTAGRRLSRLPSSVRSAVALKRETGGSWPAIVREGLAMRKSRGLSWDQVLMAANTPMMIRTGMVEGRVDVGSLASGQVAGLIDDLPSCAELIDRIVAQASEVLAGLTAPAPEVAGV
ncbi:NAD(P)H-dependent flavin oxidoreductase [Geodermatophilus chilensis]|uniref:NAD(P)H-dependent flavin oxidoreductase n=1 Tax=Geodermatophilus chilensis TaxID=2035835 RepID=UPI000C261EEC|nr:nitronate monooxygenase family protein [Geodermatophilus chilensis]